MLLSKDIYSLSLKLMLNSLQLELKCKYLDKNEDEAAAVVAVAAPKYWFICHYVCAQASYRVNKRF